MTGYALFDTALGCCGIAWTDRGVRAVQIPEESRELTRARLVHGLDDPREASPDDGVRRAVDGIVALLDGEPDDLADVVLDDAHVADFDRRVYAATRAIPVGETATYGEIATRIGGDPRAVGGALGRNPFPLVVPCHRVVGADGRMTGFSATGGVATKVRILALEGARVARTPTLFDLQ